MELKEIVDLTKANVFRFDSEQNDVNSSYQIPIDW